MLPSKYSVLSKACNAVCLFIVKVQLMILRCLSPYIATTLKPSMAILLEYGSGVMSLVKFVSLSNTPNALTGVLGNKLGCTITKLLPTLFTFPSNKYFSIITCYLTLLYPLYMYT